MVIKLTFCVLLIAIGVIARSNKMLKQECDPHKLSVCGANQACAFNASKNNYYCNCDVHYVESDGDCVEISTTAAVSTDPMNQKDEKSSSGGSVAAGLLIPTFLIILGGVGFCCAKRYRLLPCRQNVYGNVLVTRDDDDDDDPPIA